MQPFKQGPNGEELIDMEFARNFVDLYKTDITSDTYAESIESGHKLAAAYRQMFPNISDHDLSAILLKTAQILIIVVENGTFGAHNAAKQTSFAFTFAAGEVLQSVVDLDGL